MVPLQYIYLIGTLISIIPITIVYYLRQNLRPGIITAGLVCLPFTLATEYFFWAVDWWTPLTITGTRIGIEDIILTLTNCGYAFAIYPFFFKNQKNIKLSINIQTVIIIFSLNFLAFMALFWIFQVTSVIISIVLSFITSVFLIYKKPALLKPTLFTGLIMLITFLPMYWILIFISPEFIAKTWIFENLTGILFLGIPIEDILFYFQAGVFTSAVLFYSGLKNSKS